VPARELQRRWEQPPITRIIGGPQPRYPMCDQECLSSGRGETAWLISDPAAVVGGEGLLPTAKSIAFASWQYARGQLAYVSPKDPDEVEFFVPRVITDLVLPAKPREREKRFPEKDGGDVGLFLGLHLVANGSVAIFCGRKDSAAKLCRRVVDIFDRGVPFATPITVSDAAEVARIRSLSETHLGAGASATPIATSILEHTDGPQRAIIRRSPLPPAAVADLQAWLTENIGALATAAAEDRLLGAVSGTLLAYTTARSISSLSDADVVSLALVEWAAGRSYAAIHDLLSRRRVRVGRNNATIEDVVALCENGFGYVVAMVVASLADLAEPLDPTLQSALALLQRQVKNGLTDKAALAFLEAGFADRVVATALGQAWPGVNERDVVRAVCRNELGTVQAILDGMPSYFRAVATELSA
jgi:hypothetical protein